MNIRKTGIIVCVSAVLICGTIALSMWLTREKKMEMDVSSPTEGTMQEQTKVYQDGENIPLYYDDQDILLLPVRNVAQGLGGTVTWDEELREVTIIYKGKKLLLKAGTTTALMHGYQVTMDEEPHIINGCFYAEETILADFFSTEVTWDSENRQISLNANGNAEPVVTKYVFYEKLEGKEYTVEMPVIIGLNDVSYEKGLNLQLQKQEQDLIQEFILSEEDTLYFELEKGYISDEFISICWNGFIGDKPVIKTLNIDLREQKIVEISDILEDGIIQELRVRGELTDNSIFYITQQKELAIHDTSKDDGIIVLFPADGAVLTGQWKANYYNLFVDGAQ